MTCVLVLDVRYLNQFPKGHFNVKENCGERSREETKQTEMGENARSIRA